MGWVWVATAGFRRGNAGIDRNVDGDMVALSSALFGVASAVTSHYVSTAFVVLKSFGAAGVLTVFGAHTGGNGPWHQGFVR